MKRFTGEGEAPNRLDATLFEDFSELRAARGREDARIVAYIDSLSDADLSGHSRYRTIVNATEVEQPLTPALLHFFNHQTIIAVRSIAC